MVAQHVGGDHGVEGDSSRRVAVAGQDVEIVLAVVRVDRDRRIGDDRVQRLPHLVDVELGAVVVAHRHVERLVLADRNRYPDQLGKERIGGGRFDIDRDRLRRLDPLDQVGQLVVGIDDRLYRWLGGFRRHRFWRDAVARDRSRQPVEERPELQLPEEFGDLVPIVAADPRLLQVDLDRQVAYDRRQVLALRRRRAVLGEGVPRPCRRDFSLAFEDGLQRAERGDQALRRLVADARHAGDVVRRVANQRLVVRHELRAEPVAVEHGGGVEFADVAEAAGARQHHEHVILDQLEQVGIAGDDHDPVAIGGERAGQAADDIVRLVVLDLLDRDPEGGDQLLDAADLLDQVRRGRRAGSLVVLVEIVPEGPAAFERDDDVIGLSRIDDVEQHRGKAVDGVGLFAGGRRHRGRQGEVRPKNQSVAIDQDDGFLAA